MNVLLATVPSLTGVAVGFGLNAWRETVKQRVEDRTEVALALADVDALRWASTDMTPSQQVRELASAVARLRVRLARHPIDDTLIAAYGRAAQACLATTRHNLPAGDEVVSAGAAPGAGAVDIGPEAAYESAQAALQAAWSAACEPWTRKYLTVKTLSRSS